MTNPTEQNGVTMTKELNPLQARLNRQAETIQAMEGTLAKIGDHFGVAPGDVDGLFAAIEGQSTDVRKLKEIEAAALDAFYLHGYHKSPCMCVDCRLAMILKENSDTYRDDQATASTQRSSDPDITKCPNCKGPADNGHDRCSPPNPYFCSKCEKVANL